MKNLMQKLVKVTLCVGVVSVMLISCEFDTTVEKNIIDLDQLDDVMIDLDSIVSDSVELDVVIENESFDDSLVEAGE